MNIEIAKKRQETEFILPDFWYEPLSPSNIRKIRDSLKQTYGRFGSYSGIQSMSTQDFYRELAKAYNCVTVNLATSKDLKNIKQLFGEIDGENIWSQLFNRLRWNTALEHDIYSLPLSNNVNYPQADILNRLIRTTNSEGLILYDINDQDFNHAKKSTIVHETTEFLVSKFHGFNLDFYKTFRHTNFLVLEREIDFATNIGENIGNLVKQYRDKNKYTFGEPYRYEMNDFIDEVKRFYKSNISLSERFFRIIRDN